MAFPSVSSSSQPETTFATDPIASRFAVGLRLTSTRTTFLGLFLPLFILASLIAWLFLNMEQANRRRILETDIHNRMALQARIIQLTFNAIVSDLLFLSELDELHHLLDRDGFNTKVALAAELLHLASRKGIYDQVRYLDETGMEVVRINFNKGQPGIVLDGELQNKANRPYFNDAFELPRGAVSVSPLDLNIEQNQIEQPLKPVIYFSTPVFDQQGQKRGIVVLNYLASYLLADFKAMAADLAGEMHLLNRDGYWFVHPDVTQEWGFMYEERRGVTFANAFPEAWRQIQGQPKGQFFTSQGVFTFATIFPLGQRFHSSNGPSSVSLANAHPVQADDYRWTVVSFVPADHPFPTAREIRYWVFGSYGGVVLVFGIGAWLLALSRSRLHGSVAALDAKVRELEETRRGLVQSEKMASLGRMVAGFAHEINTPIGVAVGASSHMAETVKEMEILVQADEVREEDLITSLDTIRAAATLILSNLHRAARLMQSFKRTSVDQASERARRFKMAEMVDDVLNSLHSTFKHTAIHFTVDCPPDLVIYGKPGVYAQILTNLLMNSYIHAFAEGSEAGTIRVWVRQVPEKKLCWVFEDTGRGMDEATQQRIFEPFFSTRRQHGGTGLGLYICHNLVTAELKGTIECWSSPGEGTRWTIEHPLSENATEGASA